MAQQKKSNGSNNVGVVSIQKRMIVAFVFIIIFFVVLTFRIGWIQIVANEVYASKAAENQIRDEQIKPTRGSIFDRNMRELAVSTTSYRVWFRNVPYGTKKDETDQQKIDEQKKEIERQREAAIKLIASKLTRPEDEIREILSSDYSRVRVAKDVTKVQMEAIVEGRKAENLNLIEIEENSSRNYPLSTLAASVIGSVNNDGVGQSGVEKQYNDYLSGIVGRKITSTNQKGNEIPGGSKAEYSSTDGVNVVLTIDETMQYYVEEALARGLERTESERLMCVVMDPNNGDVLAMGDTGVFDPNNPNVPLTDIGKEEYNALQTNEERSAFLNKMWNNPLVSDVYDPGSVFKVVTVASAIEECSITPDTEVFCSGSVTLYDREIKCWNYPDAHGAQSVRTALINSCNPAMIQIIQRMGDTRFYDYLELFGLTRKTGIDLPYETAPLILPEEKVGPVDLATMSFGQGLSVTPIQMVSAISTIANEGKLMQPRIVKGIADKQGNMIEEFPSKIERQVVSKVTAQEIKDMMEAVAQDRTLEAAHIDGYRLGVKTGTTQKLVDGAYDNSTIIGTMAAIAPIEDPKFVILVIADDPKYGKYGNVTAGPVLNEITRELLRYMNVKPDFSEEYIESMNEDKMKVPELVGYMYSEAVEILDGYGFKPNAQGDTGIDDYEIVAQYPVAGTRAEYGSTVFLYRN